MHTLDIVPEKVEIPRHWESPIHDAEIEGFLADAKVGQRELSLTTTCGTAETYRELAPMQLSNVPVTYADTSKLERNTGFRPSTPLEDGLRAFARWYRGYYRIGVRP